MPSDWFEHLVSNYKDVVAYIINFKIPPVVGSPSQKRPEAFNICNYPFLFNAAAKTTLLQTDQAIQMHQAMQNASNDDTIREIAQYKQSDLKKPLKVKFCGEEAEDAGGVRKEFFMLLLKDLIDPKYACSKSMKIRVLFGLQT
ncbi:Probable E3 ubiquitin-protein ligase HERC4 [Eumeta japonica]|uniref:Probable E3 ubiquitin-protein ligase HERC4 n=1 Tax=Eumeta variegata TaxID=151549 RepID=A0A4C1T1F0_EUMVA|nr:Probable E3 ubiquitin-protein ligase HERC4 [Eumeta japonica]